MSEEFLDLCPFQPPVFTPSVVPEYIPTPISNLNFSSQISSASYLPGPKMTDFVAPTGVAGHTEMETSIVNVYADSFYQQQPVIASPTDGKQYLDSVEFVSGSDNRIVAVRKGVFVSGYFEKEKTHEAGETENSKDVDSREGRSNTVSDSTAAREEVEDLTEQLLGTAENTDMTEVPLQTEEGTSAKGVGENTLLSAMNKMTETLENTCKALSRFEKLFVDRYAVKACRCGNTTEMEDRGTR